MQRTLILIKPDAVARGLVGTITTTFEQRGFNLIGSHLTLATADQLRKHYCDLADKPYYPKIEQSMTLGALIVQVWQGHDAVNVIRKMIGKTDPKEAEPGTIRATYGLDIGRNIIHASATETEAEAEIIIWDVKIHDSARVIHTIHDLIYRSETPEPVMETFTIFAVIQGAVFFCNTKEPAGRMWHKQMEKMGWGEYDLLCDDDLCVYRAEKTESEALEDICVMEKLYSNVMYEIFRDLESEATPGQVKDTLS